MISSFRAICIAIVAFTGLFFVLDLLGVALAALRKKPYKSGLGGIVESFTEHPGVWWLAVIFAAMYAYGFLSLRF